jgi:hypothetical protein
MDSAERFDLNRIRDQVRSDEVQLSHEEESEWQHEHAGPNRHHDRDVARGNVTLADAVDQIDQGKCEHGNTHSVHLPSTRLCVGVDESLKFAAINVDAQISENFLGHFVDAEGHEQMAQVKVFVTLGIGEDLGP